MVVIYRIKPGTGQGDTSSAFPEAVDTPTAFNVGLRGPDPEGGIPRGLAKTGWDLALNKLTKPKRSRRRAVPGQVRQDCKDDERGDDPTLDRRKRRFELHER